MTRGELLWYALGYVLIGALAVGGIELGSWLVSPEGVKAVTQDLETP